MTMIPALLLQGETSTAVTGGLLAGVSHDTKVKAGYPFQDQ